MHSSSELLCTADIDECEGTALCPANSTCVNTFGSFDCVCDDGFVQNESVCIGKNNHYLPFLKQNDTTVCLHLSTTTSNADVDECRFNETCPEHSTCMNSIGSFTCTCNDGYKRMGNVCIGKPKSALLCCHCHEFMHA